MVAEFITSAALTLGVFGPPASIEQGAKIGTMNSKVTGSVPLIQGTTQPILSRGAGHLIRSDLPGKGLGTTTSWWAHRVTPTLGKPHGPFYNIDKIRIGAVITLRMKWGTYKYRVRRHLIIDNSNWNVFKPTGKGRERFMMAACHPKGSAAKRYVVIARRIS
jgi:sortase A